MTIFDVINAVVILQVLIIDIWETSFVGIFIISYELFLLTLQFFIKKKSYQR